MFNLLNNLKHGFDYCRRTIDILLVLPYHQCITTTTFCAFVIVEYEDKVYIFGGYNGKLGNHYNDIHVYDPGRCAITPVSMAKC